MMHSWAQQELADFAQWCLQIGSLKGKRCSSSIALGTFCPDYAGSLILHWEGFDSCTWNCSSHLLEEALLQTKPNSKAGHDLLCDCMALAHESHHVLPAGEVYIVIYVQVLHCPTALRCAHRFIEVSCSCVCCNARMAATSHKVFTSFQLSFMKTVLLFLINWAQMPAGTPCKYSVSKCNKDMGAVSCVACMHMQCRS